MVKQYQNVCCISLEIYIKKHLQFCEIPDGVKGGKPTHIELFSL